MADYESPDGRWGYINSSGELVIEARYDDAGSFSEGLASVNKRGKWGFIDQNGNEIIEPSFKSAWAFHEGFARVLPFESTDQFINARGEFISSNNWMAADDFSNSRARVKVGNSFGYIDTSGQMVIQPLYTRGWNFENGITIIEYQEKLGVIDLNGNEIIKAEFDQIKKADEANLLLARKGSTSYVFDKHGKELLQLPNAKVVDSNGEILSVRNDNSMYLIRLSDPQTKSSLYENIIYLDHDLWAGKLDSGYYMINGDGQRITNNAYQQINKFSEGFAAYSKEDYWGYLDVTGQELTGEVFGLAWDYKEGFARAAFQEGIAFINTSQALAFYPPAGTMDMRDFSEGLAAVQID